MALRKGLRVKSMMYPHKNILKRAWMSSDYYYYYSNQIDHNILINERFANSITDVRTLRTYRGVDCDSDHFLVVSKLRVKLKIISRNIKPGIIRYDVEKLKDNKKIRDFKENMQAIIIRVIYSDLKTIDDQWKIIKDTL